MGDEMSGTCRDGERACVAKEPRMTRRKKPLANPALAVAYLRCSTERQDLSPDAQRAAITRWAAAHGVAVVAWHQDLGVSGGTPLEERPGLLGALESLRSSGAATL